MHAYRALLRAFPSSFRAEYGEEMCAIFARRRRDAAGPASRLALWVETLADVFVSASRVHADVLHNDLRYTTRTLNRSRGFAATAILVAALGIGATTATFSITDHVLIRPLPFADPDRLVKLWQDQSYRGYSRLELSPLNYRDWKRMSTSFESMAAYVGISVNLVGDAIPERIDGTAVTADLLPLLGVPPLLGRVFTEADDHEGAPATLLLSHRLWQVRFGGDPDVVGRKVTLNDEPYVVIGVMPPEFHFPTRDTEIWTPMRFTANSFEDRTNYSLRAVARLKPGISLEQARSEMRLVAAQLERAYPKENERTGATVIRLRDELSEQSRLLLKALVAAAACVLLIACTNLASLLVARSLFRRRELAVRTALGAGRERLVRQLMTESLVLAAGGGGLGILIALAATPLLGRLVPNWLPIAETPHLDLRMLLFALVLTAATGVAFGVLPALRACGNVDATGLREGSRGDVGGRREGIRSALVLTEVAVSVVLLVSSGLLIRALWRVQQTDTGFRTEGVLTLRTSLPTPRYERTAQRAQFYDRVLSEARALPGVTSAAYISFLPMVMRGGIWPAIVEGRADPSAPPRDASVRYVTPGFFSTLRIPVRMGRDVSEADGFEAPFVAVVSESLVREQWPGEDPIGRRFQIAFRERTIVGVVGDIRVRGLERNSEPQVYLPYRQVPDGWLPFYTPKDLVIRSSMDPSALVPPLRRIIAAADPQQPISDVRMLSEIVDTDTAPRSVQVRVLGAFAAFALLLAAIGIHGLLAFAVSSRSQEIGVRLALGASSRDILALVLRQGLALAAGGVVLGVALGYAAGRGMEALLAGVSPRDAPTFAAAVAVSLVMTAAGSLFPALRAIRVDPLTVIRVD